MRPTKTLAFVSLAFAGLLSPFALAVSRGADVISSEKSGKSAKPAKADQAESISLSAFSDSAHHWRKIKNPDAVVRPRPNHPAYAPSQIREIAANVLLFQRANGGWPKNYDMAAILNDDERAAVAAARNAADVTFDNDTVHSQVVYLAKTALIVGRTGAPVDIAFAAVCRDAAKRGLDFILSAQYANGGFPQSWPNPQGYSAFITFNDGVMIGILRVLRDVARDEPHFAWLDAGAREKCRAALGRGTACLLATQYRNNAGVLQGWGQQHNHRTLQPDHARKFELPSLCAGDTAANARFLMGVENPSPEIIASVRAAVAWLEKVKLAGIRVETIKAAPAEYRYHNTSNDRVVRDDASAPLLWARMYELDTDRPIFCGRDGVKHYTLAEIDRDRRTGYSWYGRWPDRLLSDEYPAWEKKL